MSLGPFHTFVAAVVLILLAVWLISRVASRRRSLPCPAWLSWMVDNPFAMRRTRAALDQLRLARGMDVLDAGCGPGRLTIPIAEAIGPDGRVLAVDIQPDMLRRAREKARQARTTNIEFMLTGLGQGSLPHRRFDRAILSSVLGEIPDRLAALQAIHDSLKPGGFLLVNEVIGDPHYQSRSKVEALAEESGFRIGAYFGSRLAYSITLEKA